MRRSLLVGVSLLALSACDLAPDFTLPDVLTPAAFKEDVADELPTVEPATDGRWKRVDDKAKIEEFAWWRMFNDATLDGLMEQAMKDNPSLDAAMERVNSARAVAGNREADLYPAIEVGVGPQRERQSPASQQAFGGPANPKPYTLYKAQGTITYELDLFGKNRNRLKAAEMDAQAEDDNFRAARLSLQTELAQTYFRLAALRKEEQLLNRIVATRETALKLIRSKHAVGEVDTLALSAIETDLASVQGDAASVAASRAANEHALAVLVGKPPSELTAQVPPLNAAPPSIPAGIPSSVLERRPDIKRAVSGIAAANARIGVARTGYFPDISLSAMGGFSSGDLSDLFKWSNRTWLVGPMAGTVLTQPIFEGGRLSAAKAQSQADYGVAVAEYRSAVLQAFREVEDQLSGLRYTNEQAKAARTGLASANRAFTVADARFKAGYSSHIDYLDAQRSKLSAERSDIQQRGNQYITTIQLVKALGGSWQAPTTPETTAPVAP
jgi:multidrug efflux system outer membrane protein